jgi:arginine-tRNA-protein transferase
MKPAAGGNRERPLALYLTTEHGCSYLDGRQARTLFVDPLARMDVGLYQTLIDQGFRRSGTHVYRPACRDCNRCVPVRIPVDVFRPNRSQRRNWVRTAREFSIVATQPVFDPGHFDLYLRYLEHRHSEGSMADDSSVESFSRFLVEPWGGETCFLELRLGDRLVGIAVTDVLPYGLSAVYTFFDPDLSERGPGTFAILAQIATARRLGLPYVYLGYWIWESPKMAYKANYQPLEAWDGQRWTPLKPDRGPCSN